MQPFYLDPGFVKYMESPNFGDIDILILMLISHIGRFFNTISENCHIFFRKKNGSIWKKLLMSPCYLANNSDQDMDLFSGGDP
jgi:hypothetical protein